MTIPPFLALGALSGLCAVLTAVVLSLWRKIRRMRGEQYSAYLDLSKSRADLTSAQRRVYVLELHLLGRKAGRAADTRSADAKA